MRDFKEEIEEIANYFRGEPIFDGLVNEKEYEKSSTKILWILKEANSTGESGSWDMRGHLNSKIKTKDGILTGWSNTFKKIIYVTNGILNDLAWNDDLHHPGYDPDVIDELKKIGFINIKKVGGGASANPIEIGEYYSKSKTLLFNQIDEFNPDVIIFGGTFKYFKDDMKVHSMMEFGSCHASLSEKRILIDAYHPAYYKIKEETYFNYILRAYRSLSSAQS